jgi:3-oxoadipate enol-lactonase
MRINTIPPKDLAVEIEGSGPPVLMVHGLGGTSNFYQVQAQALADRFQVIRPDSAGAGRSPATGQISIGSHADDLAALLDRLGVSGATVVGHSMGTLVVRTLATRHPGLVSRLILLGAVAEPADAVRQAQRDRAATLRQDGTAAVAPGVVAAFVRELIMRQDPEGYARNCEALATAIDPGPVAPGLPLLLITGSDDKTGPPEVSQAIAAAHGSATVTVIDGIGHWTALEAAGDVTDQVLKFL